MSALTQKPLASNVTCRYWASSGTCFFGDQCNFAHNPDDRAASKMFVPKSEKACKELLLTGYCKNERNGCEYNHEISNMTRLGPPASSTTATNLSSSVVFSSWPPTSSTSLGTAAAIRNNRLPVSAPAFVPAAVAAAQRASLSAWGGVTPGSRESIAVTSPATLSVFSSPTKDDILMASSGQTFVVDPPTTSALAPLVLETEVSANSDPVSSGSTSLSSTFSSSLVKAVHSWQYVCQQREFKRTNTST